MDSQPYTNGSNNCTVKYWRNIVLEQMYQSPSVSKGGLQECIETALGFCPEKVFLSFVWVFSTNFLCLVGNIFHGMSMLPSDSPKHAHREKNPTEIY